MPDVIQIAIGVFAAYALVSLRVLREDQGYAPSIVTALRDLALAWAAAGQPAEAAALLAEQLGEVSAVREGPLEHSPGDRLVDQRSGLRRGCAHRVDLARLGGPATSISREAARNSACP